uniref:Uncharacterized protein n=1 Tax=Psilocybe cubensis TaxID=181762 RepID=A0A8H7XJE5_PSICU
MYWTQDASTRGLLTPTTVTFDLLPALVLYYVIALLVLIPDTMFLRLALLPVNLYALFRMSTKIDLAKGLADEQRLAYFNHALILATVTIAIRVSIWAFQRTPYKRINSKGNVAFDAADLTTEM